jgi:hypothetical protein
MLHGDKHTGIPPSISKNENEFSSSALSLSLSLSHTHTHTHTHILSRWIGKQAVPREKGKEKKERV